jgi:hypothetical protein
MGEGAELESAPSRGGSQTLVFNEEGTFAMSVPCPSDRPTTLEGTWEETSLDLIRFRLKDGSAGGTVTRTASGIKVTFDK